MAEVNVAELKTPASWWFRVRFASRMAFQKLVYAVPAISKALRFIGYRLIFLGNLRQEEQSRLDSIALLHGNVPDAQKFGSAYGYGDEVKELMVTYKYYDQIKRKDFETMPSESAVLYSEIIKRSSNLLKAEAGIKNFFNFGVCYAYVDSELAKKHPDVKFVGIDRSKYTQLFNEDNFSGIPNMEFITGDIFECLRDRKFNGDVFFHARTLVYLPKSFIQSLYKAVREAGFRYIVGFEQFGVSHETFSTYDFSASQESVLFRNNFFMHNYPALLKEAGYELRSAEFIKTHHPHEDYRVMAFVAGSGQSTANVSNTAEYAAQSR